MNNRIGLLFMGALLIAPGVYTYTDVSNMVAPRGAASRALVIIAQGRGGGVGSVTHLTSGKQVLPALVSGDLAHMAKIAFGCGVSDVYAIRVNKATPATLNWGDVVLTANNPGLTGRGLQGQRAVSAVRADAQDIHVRNATTGLTEPYLNLGPVIDVTYAGAGSTPVVAVTAASGTTTVTFGSSVSGEALSFTSDNVANAQDAVTAINNSGAWNARLVGDASTTLTELTPFAAKAAPATLASGVNAIVRALAASSFATAAPAASAATFANDFVFFSGGSEGQVPTLSDWSDAFTLAETLDTSAVAVGSGDIGVATLARSHVYNMTTIRARKERLAYLGPNLTNTKSAMKAAALALVSAVGGELMVIAGNTVKDYSLLTDTLTQYPAYYLATYAAATKLAGRPEESLTNVPVKLPGLGYVLDLDDIEELLTGGVMPAHYDDEEKQNVITQGITSWTQDANVILRKISGMDVKHYLQKKLRVRLKRFIGKPADAAGARAIRKEVVKVLDEEVRGALFPYGVLTAGNDIQTGRPQAAYRNLEVIFDGFDFTGVDFECSPVGTNEYIGVRANFLPTQIVA